MDVGEKTASVRDAAEALGVCERTIWRWLGPPPHEDAAVELLIEQMLDRRCRACGQPLLDAATLRRTFCDDSCRQAAFRRKRQAASFGSQGRTSGG